MESLLKWNIHLRKLWDPLIELVKPYSICSPEKLQTLISLSMYLNKSKIDGDIVECGTYNGGSSALLARCMSRKQRIWIYDSFKGLPAPGINDGDDEKQLAGKCKGSVAAVKEVMDKLGIGEKRYTIKEGWFDQTFEEDLPRKVGAPAL